MPGNLLPTPYILLLGWFFLPASYGRGCILAKYPAEVGEVHSNAQNRFWCRSPFGRREPSVASRHFFCAVAESRPASVARAAGVADDPERFWFVWTIGPVRSIWARQPAGAVN